MVRWSARLDRLIRDYARHENKQLKRLLEYQPVVERARPPTKKEVRDMQGTLMEVFSASATQAAEFYMLICAEMKLPYTYDPETYYNNLERMADFAAENGSAAGKGFKTTAPMGRAMIRQMARALGPVGN